MKREQLQGSAVKELAKKTDPKFLLYMAAEQTAFLLHRLHLSKVNHFGKRLLRRVLGDPIVIEVDGFRIQGPYGSRMMMYRIKAGLWESFETELFRQAVGPGMTVLDVGANIGHYCLLAAKLVGGSGVVYAIEPDPRNLVHLRHNIEANQCRNIRVIESAASAGPGKLVLQLGDTPTTTSLSTPVDYRVAGTVEVDTVALDDVLRRIPVDVIKMDIEGWEPAALEGLAATLRRSPGLKMFVEFNPQALTGAGWSPVDVLDRLRVLFDGVFVIDERRKKLVPVDEAVLGSQQNLYCARTPDHA